MLMTVCNHISLSEWVKYSCEVQVDMWKLIFLKIQQYVGFFFFLSTVFGLFICLPSAISHGVVLLSGLPYRNSVASIPLFNWCHSHDLQSSLEDVWIFRSRLSFHGYKMFLTNHEEYGLFISYAWIMRSWTRRTCLPVSEVPLDISTRTHSINLCYSGRPPPTWHLCRL